MVNEPVVQEQPVLVPVWATEQEWRVVAACIAACAAKSAEFVDDDERALTALWLRVHPGDNE